MPSNYNYSSNNKVNTQSQSISDQSMYQMSIAENLLPITPAKVTISNQDRTEVIYLANDQPFTILHFDGPQQYQFEFRIPKFGDEPNFCLPNANTHHTFWTDLLWNLKAGRQPTWLMLARHRGDSVTNVPVVLTDYSYDEDAEKHNDFIFNVTFINYHGQANAKMDVIYVDSLVKPKNARGWLA